MHRVVAVKYQLISFSRRIIIQWIDTRIRMLYKIYNISAVIFNTIIKITGSSDCLHLSKYLRHSSFIWFVLNY